MNHKNDPTRRMRLRRARMFALAASVLTVLALGGCGEKRKKLPQSNDTITVPYQEFGRTTLFSFDGPYKIWRLETDYMKKNMGDTASMLAVPVMITMYDSLGETGTRILADSGRTNSDLESFDIWGNVYVKTDEGLVIKSQSLWWHKMSHRVGSEDYVQIETPEGDILRGKGLDANESFSRWSLRENVSGHFPNFRERVEKEQDADADSSAGEG